MKKRVRATRRPATTNRPRWSDYGPDDLLNEHEAAGLLRVSIFTLRSWRCADPVRGPVFARIGSSVRYKLSSLRKYIERQSVDSVDDPRTETPNLRRAG